ncbi:Adenosine deaminase [Chionoecetes opilio]|uniref:Adenosine deaminase n=1 Tax=Chionoecetes opilio TaxID=41210 RepID=A0A8J4Y691_CHIOP|nr:Adenosine deaminase [Chionoecetes opilio]
MLKGLARGEQQFGTKARVILSCLRQRSEWSWDMLRLCEEYKERGVVGIDMAGDEGLEYESESFTKSDVECAVFQAAKEKGIHRTVHACEEGPAICVKKIIFTLRYDSYLTGDVQSLTTSSKRHPILRLAEDEVRFSINSDDPTLTHTRLSDEYKLFLSWGFTEAHLARANFQAALHSFLPPEEKKQLIDQLQQAYGFSHYSCPLPPPPPLHIRDSFLHSPS